MEQERDFYTCRYDRAFKEVFAKEENKEILKRLLESILEIEIDNIKYLNVERITGNIKVKGKRFDLYLDTNIGKIQVEVNKYIYPRNMGYICKTYASYILKGKDYEDETKIIQINISYDLKDKEKIRVYRMQDKDKKLYVKNLYIYEINMEKYKDIWYSKNEEEIKDSKYIIMLDLKEEELKELSIKDKEIKKYMEEIKRVNEDPDFIEYMSAEEDARKIQNSLKKEWKEEALEQGLEQGIEQGAIQEKISIAKNMLSDNIDIKLISKYTNLTISEINKLTKIDRIKA